MLVLLFVQFYRARNVTGEIRRHGIADSKFHISFRTDELKVIGERLDIPPLPGRQGPDPVRDLGLVGMVSLVVFRYRPIYAPNGRGGLINAKHRTPVIAARVHVVILSVKSVAQIVTNSHVLVGQTSGEIGIEEPVPLALLGHKEKAPTLLGHSAAARIEDHGDMP